MSKNLYDYINNVEEKLSIWSDKQGDFNIHIKNDKIEFIEYLEEQGQTKQAEEKEIELYELEYEYLEVPEKELKKAEDELIEFIKNDYAKDKLDPEFWEIISFNVTKKEAFINAVLDIGHNAVDEAVKSLN
ncbi:hypothetical protein [Methanobrevibacter sp. DSM 116169]|uniref:hypothetical protein n=1 Tax=Methanobrevibacter sp. DSM 116169 TaxID=3242727 RepID=UPI0038FCF2C4